MSEFDDLRKELISAAERLAPIYKIEAIRYYRCATNCYLKEAKEHIEQVIKEYEERKTSAEWEG